MKQEKVRTMEDFAALSGISRPTLSKFFNDPNSVRNTTREKIEAALELFDYTPNFYAINQNRALTRNIGIVVPFLADPFFAEIARTLEQKCIAAGYRPMLYSSHGSQSLEVDILHGLRSLKPAGALLAPLGRASDRAEIEKFARDVPTVLFDSNLEDMGEAFIGSDNYSFVAQTVHHLMQSGEAPAFYEMRTPANPNANKRRNAYIKVMEEIGADPHIIKIDGEGWSFEEIGRQGAHVLLDQGPLPRSSILCSNDRLAIGFLSACYERGIRVGKDESCALRLASNDDHPFSRFTCPSLTTAAHDYANVSEKSVETLLELVENGGKFQTRDETVFAAKLVIRNSA